MNLNELLKTLLATTGLPVEQDEYDGKEQKYIIFMYEDEHPEIIGDNQVLSDTANIQVQLITPKNFNYFKLKKQIRDLLEGADFIVSSTHSFLGDIYQGTEKTRQTVFEIEYNEGRRN